MISRVYVYGVPGRWVGDVPAEIDEQLVLADRLRGDLVRLWRERGEAWGAVWSSDPRIAAVEEEIAAAETEAEVVAEQATRERSAARARGVTASSGRLSELRKVLREARRRRRELISVVRADRADDLARAEDNYRAGVRATYKTYCQDGALYWATYNDVLNQHRKAAARVAKTRAAGQVAQLRQRRFDGSGCIAVQLQRDQSRPPRSPARIADGQRGPWRNVLHLTPWVPPEQWAELSSAERRRRQVGQVRMNLGGGRWVTLPVLVHRMLPPDAEIIMARLVIRRIAGHRRMDLHVVVSLPDPAPPTGGPVVAVHLGWRRDPDRDWVRVATWRSTAPLAIPPDLDARHTQGAPVVADTDTTGQIVLPGSWWRRLQRHDQIQAERDLALDDIRATLVTWLHEHGPVQIGEHSIDAAEVTRWRAPGRFATLALAWRDTPPPAGTGLAAALEHWRRHDRRRWEGHAHGRARALAHRDDTYRRIAAWLARTASTILVDDTNLAALARHRDPALPPTAQHRAARQRTLAAPGQLRTILHSSPVPVTTVDHTGISRTHYRCGHLNPADDRYATSRVVPCDGCHSAYDQDASATLIMLAAHGHAPPPGHTTTNPHPPTPGEHPPR